MGIQIARISGRRILLACVLALAGCDRSAPPEKKPAASVQPTEQNGSPATSADLSQQAAGQPATDAVVAEQPSPAAGGHTGTTATHPDQTDNVPAFEPLADAQVGEWVHLAGMDSRELRYEIVRVGAATVTTRVTVLQNGKPLGLPANREDMRNWDPLASVARGDKAVRSVSKDTIEVAGRQWDAMVYEDRWTEEKVSYTRRTWIHPESPVFGTLRMELFGDSVLEAKLELTGYGRPGQPPTAAGAR